MLFGRTYKPKKDEIIYHYCTPDAFFAIVQNRKLWFSDVFSMNDSLEVHWGYRIFEKASSELLSNIPKIFFDEVDKEVIDAGKNVLPLVACFSLDGDVLSQWRAYAADGHGFALGFSAEEMIKLPIRPLRVLYDEKQQVEEMKAQLLALYDTEKEEGFSYGADFAKACHFMATDLCAFKNPAFKEEQEVRLAHAVIFKHQSKGISLASVGGYRNKKEEGPSKIVFRMKGETPVPHVEMTYSDNTHGSPLREVVLGPTNRNSVTNVEVFLTTIGYENIRIRKSLASYTN